MKYKRLVVRLEPNDEAASAILQAQLGAMGFESFVETDAGFEGYVQCDLFDEAGLQGLDPMVEGVAMECEIADADDRNWNEEWEKSGFTPIDIDGRLVIRSTEHEPRPDVETEVLIDPEMAFGTGHHETTRMLLRWILDTDFSGRDVLDMGCGTAVLAILMLKRGAKSAVGIDIDDWSVRNSEKNAALNGVRVDVRHGDAALLDSLAGRFDAMIANINRNILVRDMPAYAQSLRPGALMAVSGFYLSDADAVQDAAVACGLTPEGRAEENGWQMMTFRKE